MAKLRSFCRYVRKRLFAGGLVVAGGLFALTPTWAVEVLSAGELNSHCVLLADDPDGVDGQYCIRYIQGFIDGAVATDARVMLNVEEKVSGSETYTQRAMRTRAPSRADMFRAAKLAGFCLGDPLPLRAVVDNVVASLGKLTEEQAANASAMDTVYAALVEHYPCAE